MSESNAIAAHPQLDNKSLAGTFAQRGYVLPFTTGLLSFSRLRISSEGEAEILVPGMTGGASLYVVPLSALGETVSFSVFDRSFVEKLSVSAETSPSEIRAIARQVALMGIAGPKLAKAAKQAIDLQNNILPLLTISLTQAAIDQLAGHDPAAQDLDEKKLATPDGMILARKALQGYAESVGLTPGQIFSCFENWGEIIAEIGTPSSIKGHLSIQIDELERLAAELDAWKGEEPPKTGEICQQIIMVINQTLLHATEYQRETYSYVNHMGETLKNWQEISKRIRFASKRLELVLDGWGQIIQHWDIAYDFDRIEKRAILIDMALALPVLPEEEVTNDQSFWQDLRKHQSRWLAIKNGIAHIKPSEPNEDDEIQVEDVASGDAA